MLAHDFYPEGHQGGVGIIQNGLRIATNGDVRLEPTPGQWSPIPKVGSRIVDSKAESISVRMEYPDESKDRKGFNPIDYPDLTFAYHIRVHPVELGFEITVDLESELSNEWLDRVGFNIEFFPGYFIGKSYRIEDQFGILPPQANGPGFYDAHGEYQTRPLAEGKKLILAPEDELVKVEIESLTGQSIQLIDGRSKHNNGWFVARSLLGPGMGPILRWKVTPYPQPDWQKAPIVQVSQVGYHPSQSKVAVIEIDSQSEFEFPAELFEVTPDRGLQTALEAMPIEWGKFLRYRYGHFDFSNIQKPGMYIVRYRDYQSSPFQISSELFSRHVWQPTVDTFLPVQMCHMRVNDNYRVWHGLCHMDDGRMAPVDFNHFDGYIQGPSTLTQYAPNAHIPGMTRGGWHDAGDYDLRIESQSDTVYGLALAYEEFRLDYDNTSIDQENHLVELNRPDGKPDVLQQVEHGVLSIVDGYVALGRLYRGIIEPSLRQYTHLGDAATVTDNLAGNDDDRWVFTEENPGRELSCAAALAAASRVLPVINPQLAKDALTVAFDIYNRADFASVDQKAMAAAELYLATRETKYLDYIRNHLKSLVGNMSQHGWFLVRLLPDVPFAILENGLRDLLAETDRLSLETPYGIPYRPAIWGAGWDIQRFGVQQYWLHSRCPEIFSDRYLYNAIHFVLGCHPGSNPASFVSGVGAKSMIPGYGVNRADNSYIPGGIGSGTTLIRPDFPEFLEWPYLWQQTEYCVGYSTSDFVFIIAAANHLLGRKPL